MHSHKSTTMTTESTTINEEIDIFTGAQLLLDLAHHSVVHRPKTVTVASVIDDRPLKRAKSQRAQEIEKITARLIYEDVFNKQAPKHGEDTVFTPKIPMMLSLKTRKTRLKVYSFGTLPLGNTFNKNKGLSYVPNEMCIQTQIDGFSWFAFTQVKHNEKNNNAIEVKYGFKLEHFPNYRWSEWWSLPLDAYKQALVHAYGQSKHEEDKATFRSAYDRADGLQMNFMSLHDEVFQQQIRILFKERVEQIETELHTRLLPYQMNQLFPVLYNSSK